MEWMRSPAGSKKPGFALHPASRVDAGLVLEPTTIQFKLLRVVMLGRLNGDAVGVLAELPTKAVTHRQPILAAFWLRFHVLHEGQQTALRIARSHKRIDVIHGEVWPDPGEGFSILIAAFRAPRCS